MLFGRSRVGDEAHVGLSMPMPKAMVATMTRPIPRAGSGVWFAARAEAVAGVVGQAGMPWVQARRRFLDLLRERQ